MKENQFLPRKKRKSFFFARSCFLFLCCVMMISNLSPTFAQSKKKYTSSRSISSTPNGYTQVGNTLLYYRQELNSIDFLGFFNDYYYGSTYGNGGYRVAMQVNDNLPSIMDCLNGSVLDGVIFKAYVEPQGELARICYTITNTTNEDVVVSLGTHADVMIGNNDRAPISRRVDTAGNTYGVTMKDGNGAQLCVLFGSGLSGVTSVNDYWFGYYGLNYDEYSMVGNYSSGSNYMEENGSYDSGMGWCWKNRIIKVGETLNLSYLIGIGDVNLEPNLTFEVTSDDPEGWNDLSRPHKLTINGKYESPAGIAGIIEYAVEDSEEWHVLTDTLFSGEEFTAELIAMFNPDNEVHTIRFRTIDAVGNTTLLTPIIFEDVYYHEIIGIENKMYHYGDSIYQTNITCDLDKDQYVVNNYHNNVNAGTATFMVQGVFPKTIGRRTYSFEISPLALEGNISLIEDSLIYTGDSKFPSWQFTSEWNDNLVKDVDYTVVYKNNIYPGEGTIEVSGKGNYTGTLIDSFFIDKAQLTNNLYEFILPDNDICYDSESHAATVSKMEGVGDVMITYVNTEDNSVSTEAPVNTGSYDVYAEFAEGTLYYGKANEKIGSFAIYHFDENEWQALYVLNTQLQENGWTTLWNMSAGPVAVGKFDGLVIEQGHVVGVEFINKGLTGVPTGLIAFSQLRTVDLSHNALTGNAGLLAAQLPNLTSLNLSYNQFSDLFPMISPSVTFLDVSYQTIDKTITLNLSDLKIEDIATTVPTILLYDHTAQTYNPNINLMCTTAESNNIGPDDWAMQIAVNNGSISLPYVSQNNAYYGESGDILNVFDMNSGSSFKIALDFDRGDANFVGGIDAADLQTTILYAFGGYRNYPFNFTAADTYKDGNINVQDVICTVNILLAQTDMQLSIKRKASRMEAADAEAVIYMQDGNIVLRSEKQVAAISVRANGNVEWHLDKYGLEQTVVGGKAVGYSLTGGTLPVGETVIGSYTGNASVEYASLADQEAQNVTVLFGKDSVTGIQSVKELMDGDAQFYDVTGRRIERLNKGVNIIKSGNRTIKVINGMNR